eukprot:scaffold42519_cov139-Skeletonema_dohrnii-CCMP3373.AAC.5
MMMALRVTLNKTAYYCLLTTDEAELPLTDRIIMNSSSFSGRKSLLSFFGKPNKKLRLNENDGESNQQTIQGEDEVKDRHIATSNIQAEEDQVASVAIEETDASNDKVNVEKKAVMAPETAALKTNVEEQQHDTDTTQSKESDDSDSSSSSDEDEDEEEDHTSTADTSNSNSNRNPHEKSEYELMRERNIARNNARLKALGLFVGSSDVGSGLNADNRKKQRRRTKAAKVTNKTSVIEPTRRSSRLSGVKMNYTDDDSGQVINREGASFKKQIIDIEQEVKEEEEQFKVSPLFDYQMNDGGASSTTTITASEPGCNISNNGKIKTLVPSGKRLVPPAGLNAIYSLQFYNAHETTYTSSTTSPSPWLVGAGKSGLIAIWDCNNSSRTTQEEEDQISYVEPVMSWKGHGGRWIADARFLPPIDSSNALVPSRLLTAGNDGSVCHWDLSNTSLTTGAPRLLHKTNKSLHSSGIFSMDVKAQQEDCLIVTGSKDKSIAVSKLSRLADNDGALWRTQFHTSKVACVSFSSSTINPLIASASDDGLVGIHDMRLNGSDSNSTVACLEDSHVRPHSAVWKPSSDSFFLTAGLDDIIKLWDLRNTRKPVVSFHGHVPASGKTLKRIHRPTFCNVGSDSFILSGGENSHAISMFQVDEETNDASASSLRSVFSRGKLPDGSGDVGSMAVHSNQVAVTVEGGEVIVLTPQS